MKVQVHWQRLDHVDRAGKVCDVWVTYQDWQWPIPRIGEFLVCPGPSGDQSDEIDYWDEEPEWKVTEIRWSICDPTDAVDLVIVCTLQNVPDQLVEYIRNRDIERTRAVAWPFP